MEEKKVTKINLSNFLLILALIIIIIMGIFIYKINIEKTTEFQKSAELQTKVNSLNDKINIISNTINNDDSNNIVENTTKTEKATETANTEQAKETNNAVNYNSNFSQSVFKILNENDATIQVPIWVFNNDDSAESNQNYSKITINKKHEAYWYNEGNNTFPETYTGKVADNVINAWYVPLGQDIESFGCLLFLKSNGDVTYLRIDYDPNHQGVTISEEKKLNGISNISNIIVTESGFYGAIFIKEDGTALPLKLYELSDMTKMF